jgi:hypothetical protein
MHPLGNVDTLCKAIQKSDDAFSFTILTVFMAREDLEEIYDWLEEKDLKDCIVRDTEIRAFVDIRLKNSRDAMEFKLRFC